MLVNNTTVYSGLKQRHLKTKASESSFPQNSYPMTNRYFERPLENNSADLSFKGLSFSAKNEGEKREKKPINGTLALLGGIAAAGLLLRLAPGYKKVGTFKISELNEFFDTYDKSLKSISEGLIDNLKNSKLKSAKKLVQVEGDNITLYKKTIPQLIWDGLIYPFTQLPADIYNGSVKLLSKIKPLRSRMEAYYNSDRLWKLRQKSKLDAKTNALQGLFETKNDLLTKFNEGKLTAEQVTSELFQKKVKLFDTQKYGAYDTKHERALNRLVSGIPPAVFLANDAYNLSRMMDDDPKKATKEKKIRFRQEITRIVTSGYLTLITLGALNKYINNSKFGIMLMTGLTVLFTEAFSRLTNGKHIKRLTPEEARAENDRNRLEDGKVAPQPSFKAIEDWRRDPKRISLASDLAFRGKEKVSEQIADDVQKEEVKTADGQVQDRISSEQKYKQNTNHQKPLLSFDILLKASAVVIAAGFALKGIKKAVPSYTVMMNAIKKPFNNLYKKLTRIEDYAIPKAKFDKITDVLEQYGYKDLAADYKKIAEKLIDKEGMLHLGPRDKKYIKPIVNFVIAPFKFMANAVTLPYRLTDKLVKAVRKKPVPPVKSPKEIAEEINRKNVEVLAKTVENIGKKALEKGMTEAKFKSYVNDNILKAFNVTTMSNVSNAELSNLAKTAATAATLWFLMTDNYNMVMLKSDGKDVEGAETKFKERFVQEISRLFYQTLLIDLFNSTFRSQYNATLAGMSWVTFTDTTIGEILTRKSVGMPVGAHSRDELMEIEKKQNEATGFLKGYYNFMRRLTGKRPMNTYLIAPIANQMFDFLDNRTGFDFVRFNNDKS